MFKDKDIDVNDIMHEAAGNMDSEEDEETRGELVKLRASRLYHHTPERVKIMQQQATTDKVHKDIGQDKKVGQGDIIGNG